MFYTLSLIINDFFSQSESLEDLEEGLDSEEVGQEFDSFTEMERNQMLSYSPINF